MSVAGGPAQEDNRDMQTVGQGEVSALTPSEHASSPTARNLAKDTQDSRHWVYNLS